ncbi:axial regulator YABBY 4 [Cornus florida]|uniref:axial regulator YABBY 4 n=1 Tax=Cornus florida TaxID=4283 RepID=UPI002897B508|nr:axial regulator YABBY 4 [Cornus florida]
MSTLNHIFDLQEQICYVQCGYCTTILLVSVPCSSLSMVVTVRCGHCTSLLSVNMTRASFVPLHLLAPLNQDETIPEGCSEEVDAQKLSDKHSPSLMISSDEDEEEAIVLPVNHAANKPPVKRQRAPSAYNNFIKEEIRRLKIKYPNMTHKEAFSTAAKNWALFPPIQNKEEESCGQEERKKPRSSDVEDRVYVHWKRWCSSDIVRNFNRRSMNKAFTATGLGNVALLLQLVEGYLTE